MKLDDIKAAIVSGRFDLDEVRELEQAVRFAKGQATTKFKGELKVGDRVQFNAGPRRGMRVGSIAKINIKKVKVNCPDGCWNVPASCLETV